MMRSFSKLYCHANRVGYSGPDLSGSGYWQVSNYFEHGYQPTIFQKGGGTGLMWRSGTALRNSSISGWEYCRPFMPNYFHGAEFFLRSSSASQEIPHGLWKPKLYYRIHKRPPTFPIVRQINPVHVSPSNFLKIHFNIIFPSTPESFKWSLSHQNPLFTFLASHMWHMPSSFCSFLFHYHYYAWLGVCIIKLLNM